MEADWEVEIGGSAPVIEADWSGFVELHNHPECIGKIVEAATFPALASLLLVLNAPESPVWTAKCNLWEPESAALAAYIDILPREGIVFGDWQQAEAICREYVGRLEALALPECESDCRIDLVIRQAHASGAEGFGITAYLSTKGAAREESRTAMAVLMAGFANALPRRKPPETTGSKLQ
jgi:hypothetical protein